MTIKCPKCQFENPDDSIYCAKCATPLETDKISVSHTKTLETPKEELAAGSTFAQRYQIIEELGKGGMGKVYKAFDKEVNEKVALKLIKPEIAADQKTIERFRNELRLARKIVQKNVGRMYDIGKEEESYFITMEYVSGQDLKGLIKQTGQLAVGTSLSIAKQICQGLSEAHKLGVVHRDLKPGNIMIDTEGNVRIMDFGIARSIKGKGITDAGVMIGTPEYMSPEQVDGRDPDQRSDIYSLGIIMYEMMTGRVPFEGDTPLSVAVKHKTEPPPDPIKFNSQIPEDLSRVILKCLEKDKQKRYQNADEVLNELSMIEKGIPTAERIIPERKPITSKEITVTFGLKKLIIPVLAVVVISVIAVILLTRPGLKVDPDLVAVAVFENQTGDPSLNALGRMAADWITQGLSQTGLVKVVPTMTVLQSSWMTRSESGAAQGIDQLQSLGEETGAGTLISGVYYLADEELQFHASITDVKHGKLLHSLEPIKGSLDKKMEVIENLRQHIMGALALDSVLIGEAWKSAHTPTFEAYQEYMSGIEYFGLDYARALRHFERAAELDPDFMSPRLRMIGIYSNTGAYEKAESVARFLDIHREKLTPLERALLDWWKASLQGKLEECFRILRQAEKLAPKDTVTRYLVGLYALHTNRPQITVDTLTKSKLPETWYKYIPGSWWHSVLASAHHMLGNYKEELKTIRYARQYYPDMLSLRSNEVRALAAMGKIEEIQRIIDESIPVRSQFGTAGEVMLAAARELSAHDYLDSYKEIVNRAIEWYQNRVEEEASENQRYGLARVLYLAERWEESLALFEKLAEENPVRIDYKGYLGKLAARRGDREGAEKISEELKNMDRPYLRGRHTYWRACIVSILGERQQAVSLLREAYAQGQHYSPDLYNDMDLEPLRDYPPFKEFMKPKD